MSFLLAHEVLEAPGSAERVYVLHGVLGSGQNFRGFVRQLQRQVPELTYVLVDLRNHGGSTPAPAPHTVAACAGDIAVLDQHLSQIGPPSPPKAIIGHSFGGKVALAAAPKLGLGASQQVILLDSNPGTLVPTADHEVLKVIQAVRAVPKPIQSRADAVDALVRQGLSSGLARWMTTNLKREGDTYNWVFDLEAIEELLSDYFSLDLWPYVESGSSGPRIRIVMAQDSDRFSEGMRSRAASAAARSANVDSHTIPNAGHWLHVDNPKAVLALLTEYLR